MIPPFQIHVLPVSCWITSGMNSFGLWREIAVRTSRVSERRLPFIPLAVNSNVVMYRNIT